MKIRIERTVLTDHVAWILRCVSARGTLPALGGVLLEAQGGELRFAGTDLEIAGESRAEANVEDAGRTVLPGRVLGEITKSLPEGTVTIEGDAGQVTITCGTARFTLRTLPSEDFPALVVPEGAPGGDIEGAIFTAMVGQVTRAASHDEARPVLTGTLFESTPERITLVATDSYRLAVREVPWQGPAEPAKRVIPARALQETARAGEADAPLRVALGESQAMFERGGRRLTTRLIEGEFPNWRQLVPGELPNRLRIDKDAFAEAVRRVGILAQSGAPVRIDLSTGGVDLAAGTQDVGEAAEHVEGKYEGEAMTVAFNPQYLLDGVLAVEGSEIQLSARDALKPAVIRSPEDPSFTYLAMPVRIS